jgi:hypothetical protein
MTVLVEGLDRDGYTGVLESAAAGYHAAIRIPVVVPSKLPWFRAYLGQDQSIATSAPGFSSITWDTWLDGQIFTSDLMPVAGVPFPEAGLYLIGAQVRWVKSGVGTRFVQIEHSGSSDWLAKIANNPISTWNDCQQVQSLVWAQSGDTFNIGVWQDSGGDLAVVGSVETHVWAVRIDAIGTMR